MSKEQAEKASQRRKPLIYVLTAIMLVVSGVALAIYWRHRDHYPHTRDALLHANYVLVAPQVEGAVVAVHVKDNQLVRAGDLMLEIDPRPYIEQLNEARSNLTMVLNDVQADASDVRQKEAEVEAAKTDIVRAEADLKYEQQTFDETKESFEQQVASQREMNRAIDRIDVAKAAVVQAEADLLVAEAELEATRQRKGNQEVAAAAVEAAESQVRQAEINLGYTKIHAPADAFVSQFEIRVGQVVTAGQQLFPLVETKQWWVYANYKETQLHRIMPGQKAMVKIDMYPGKTFQGTVQSLGAASAASFSLLPPQNTTGNWVKVTQRITVRIGMIEQPGAPFRHGASCEVTVDTVTGK